MDAVPPWPHPLGGALPRPRRTPRKDEGPDPRGAEPVDLAMVAFAPRGPGPAWRRPWQATSRSVETDAISSA